jgi:hypothetical protein
VALAQTAGASKRAYLLEPVRAGETAVDLLSRRLAEEPRAGRLDDITHRAQR